MEEPASSLPSSKAAAASGKSEVLEFLSETFLNLKPPSHPSSIFGEDGAGKNKKTLETRKKLKNDIRETVNWSQRTLVVEGFGKLALAAKG